MSFKFQVPGSRLIQSLTHEYRCSSTFRIPLRLRIPPMSAIDTLFAELRSRGQKALMPFITAGDPDIEFTAAMLRELVHRGAHMFEVGVPYSDPIADGPVVQASYTRALAKHIKLHDIFATLKQTTPDLPAPVVTMVSYAIVYRHGLEQYVEDARAAGVAGAIVPDLPVEEAAALAKICRRRDFSLIQLVTPTTPRERPCELPQARRGFCTMCRSLVLRGNGPTYPRN